MFKQNFECLLTNKRYKNISAGNFICSPGSCPRSWTWGSWGSNLSVCPSRYLLLNHWTKSNQIWCMSNSHERGVQRHIFSPVPWGPGEGPKSQISLNFNYKVNFKDFKPNFACLLAKIGYKNISDRNFIRLPGSCPRVGTLGAGGSNPSPCLSRYLLLNHWTKSTQIWRVSYSYEWGMQRLINLARPIGPWVLGEGPKGQISFKISLSNFS